MNFETNLFTMSRSWCSIAVGIIGVMSHHLFIYVCDEHLCLHKFHSKDNIIITDWIYFTRKKYTSFVHGVTSFLLECVRNEYKSHRLLFKKLYRIRQCKVWADGEGKINSSMSIKHFKWLAFHRQLAQLTWKLFPGGSEINDFGFLISPNCVCFCRCLNSCFMWFVLPFVKLCNWSSFSNWSFICLIWSETIVDKIIGWTFVRMSFIFIKCLFLQIWKIFGILTVSKCKFWQSKFQSNERKNALQKA